MLYAALKFLHVVAAVVWIGGTITITVLNARIASTRNREALAALSNLGPFFGQAVLGPAAGLTLLAGIVTALNAGFPLRSLWILWGFAAILLSVALGATLIRVTTQRLSEQATAADGEPAQIAALQGRLALWNGINILLLLSAVWAMVAKPTL